MRIQLMRVTPIPNTYLYTLECRRGNMYKEFIFDELQHESILKFCSDNDIFMNEYVKGEEYAT